MNSEVFKMHARTTGYKKRLARSLETIQAAFERSDKWYVALSGGKDSTVVYELARLIDPIIPAVFSDDEWWLPETKEYIERLQSTGADLRWIRTNARHVEWFSTAGDYDGIPDYARQSDLEGCFLGLRKDENAYRRIGISNRGELFFSVKDQAWNCTPIADWSVRDVWAFIFSEGLDYNRAYDKLTEMGISIERQRIGPLAVDRALGYGQLAILKRGWPDLFNRFAKAHPEARAYV